MEQLKRFAIQLLEALRMIKRHKIIHCDLKPENILIDDKSNNSLKLIDFGSSCFEHERIYTYIQSRFYRAPEIILGMSYGTNIDMWSFGCVLAELYNGSPIFPGESELAQISLFTEFLGPPPAKIIKVHCNVILDVNTS